MGRVNIESDREIMVRELKNWLRTTFHFEFPLDRASSHHTEAADAAVRVAIGGALFLAFLGAWFGYFRQVTSLVLPAFWLLAVAGLLFGAMSFFSDNGWMLVGATALTALAVLSATCVGSDLCRTEEYLTEISKLDRGLSTLRQRNLELRNRVDELGGVHGRLREVGEHLGESVEEAESFVRELQKMFVLQTVSELLNLYFTPGGNVLAESLEILQELAPSFDFGHLAASLRDRPLSLPELASLIDAIVAEEPAERVKVLEDLESRVSRHSSRGLTRIDRAVRAGAMETVLTETKGMAGEAETWFACCGVMVYSPLHLVAMLSSLGGLLLVAVALARQDMPDVACSLLVLGLASCLAVSGKNLAMVRELQEQAKTMGDEIDVLERDAEKLASQVAHLARLQRGFVQLQAKFGDSVEQARDALRQRNDSVKTSTIAVVMHLFTRADRRHSGVLNEEEVEDFVQSLNLVFHAVPDFDPEQIRKSVCSAGFREEQLVELTRGILAERPTAVSHIFSP